MRKPMLAAMGVLATLSYATQIRAVTFIQGVDVYTGDGAVNWTTAKNAGIKFAFVKATEGVNYLDPRFTANMQGAAAAGVYVGPYHFCRIDSKNGVPFTSYDGLPFPVGSNPYLDATSEASDFLNAILPYYQSGYYLPPVADVEGLPDFGDDLLNQKFISNWVQLFSDTVNNELGIRPMIYTSKSGANTYYTDSVAGSHKLWLAWWKGTGTTSPPQQSNTPHWAPWTFWQWSASEVIPGVPGSNGPNNDQSDADVFYGTMSQLTSLLFHHVAGDYNHDNVVSAADYVLWRKTKGSTTNLTADGSLNNVVDISDYTYWRSHFGQSASAAGAGAGLADLSDAAVPEPTGLVLAFVAVIIGVARKSR